MRIPQRPPFTGKKYDYRNVLEELTRLEKFKPFFEKEETAYPYWEKWKYIAKEWGILPEKLWFAVKSARLGKRKVLFSDHKGFHFNISSPSIIQQYLHELDMNLGGVLQSSSIIPEDDKDRYLISSLMEEAIASSQLEGAATTRKIAKEMLETSRKPKNTSEQMIANNYAAMQWVVANKGLTITTKRILEIHSIISKGTLGAVSEEGQFRKDDQVNVVDVQTGNVIYTPPSHIYLEELMDAFCHYANDHNKDALFVHPISKAIILHFLIGYIHPFSDGNGRTARTVFYWYLIKKGYWLIEYMSVSRIILESKARYARAYLHTELDENDLTYFILYNLEAIQTALEDLKKYIRKKTDEKQNTLALIRYTDYNDRQVILLKDILLDNTVYFTVKQVETRFKISNQTARTDLQLLVDKGILAFRKNGSRLQYFPTQNAEARIKK